MYFNATKTGNNNDKEEVSIMNLYIQTKAIHRQNLCQYTTGY